VIDSIDIKLVIEDTACLNNSYLTNHVMPNSKESRIQGKFIPKCHNCWKIGHIRPNCYLLKSHKPWIKQDALRKSEVEDSSSSKFVPPHRRHIKDKGNIVCKNANHISAEKVKLHSNKKKPAHLSSLWHHQSHPTQISTSSGSEVEGSKRAANKSYIRHSTSDCIPGSTSSATTVEVGSCQSEWQIKEVQIKTLQEKAVEAH
jgi:hypothetical protein